MLAVNDNDLYGTMIDIRRRGRDLRKRSTVKAALTTAPTGEFDREFDATGGAPPAADLVFFYL